MYSSLYELLSLIERGRKLHVGVVFLGYERSEKLMLPKSSIIHSSPYCEYRKETLLQYKSCIDCRNRAIKKAVILGKSFSDYCVGGIYEYLHPVVIDGETIAVVYITNILRGKIGKRKITLASSAYEEFKDTMESDISDEECEEIASLVDSYIRMLIKLCPKEDNDPNLPTVVRDIMSYVDSNLDGDMELISLASIFHYNEKYLGRLFKKATGKTLNQYICEKRIEAAEKLLRSTDLSVTEISLRTGFGNVTYFNRRFLRAMGMPPTAYRKQAHSKE